MTLDPRSLLTDQVLQEALDRGVAAWRRSAFQPAGRERIGMTAKFDAMRNVLVAALTPAPSPALVGTMCPRCAVPTTEQTSTKNAFCRMCDYVFAWGPIRRLKAGEPREYKQNRPFTEWTEIAEAVADPVAPETPTPSPVCNKPAPDRSGRTCDLPSGHEGDHWTCGGRTLTWKDDGSIVLGTCVYTPRHDGGLDYRYEPAHQPPTPPPGTWQPMSSAPKDGTRVLLVAPYDDFSGSFVVIGEWSDEEECFITDEAIRVGPPPTGWSPLPPVPLTVACPRCKGVGHTPMQDYAECEDNCPRCGGAGIVDQALPPPPIPAATPAPVDADTPAGETQER